MQSYQEMSREELLREKESLEQQYKEICKKGLKLDMSRGKPSKEQLELSMPMMDVLTSETPLVSRAGTDIRNYGDRWYHRGTGIHRKLSRTRSGSI